MITTAGINTVTTKETKLKKLSLLFGIAMLAWPFAVKAQTNTIMFVDVNIGAGRATPDGPVGFGLWFVPRLDLGLPFQPGFVWETVDGDSASFTGPLVAVPLYTHKLNADGTSYLKLSFLAAADMSGGEWDKEFEKMGGLELEYHPKITASSSGGILDLASSSLTISALGDHVNGSGYTGGVWFGARVGIVKATP